MIRSCFFPVVSDDVTCLHVDMSSFPEVMTALYQNIYRCYMQKINVYCITMSYICNLSFYWISFLCLIVSFLVVWGEYHWICLHTINICILHGKPMIVLVLYTVLYLLSLCYEQSLHRQLFIETSTGCSCVWILLDPYPHDHYFILLLVTVSIY